MAKKSNKPKEEPKATEEKSEEVEVKPEEAVEESKPKTAEEVKDTLLEKAEVGEDKDEDSQPKFKNNGKDIKINLGNRDESNWITVKAEETVTIPRKLALANGLEEVK